MLPQLLPNQEQVKVYGMKRIEVVGALIVEDGKILIAQRPEGKAQGLKWEFPGGKIEAGETPEACLAREIDEELGVTIVVGSRYETVTHHYPEGLEVQLSCYWARRVEGTPRPLQCRDWRWVAVEELEGVDFSAADVPVVARLRREGLPGVVE